MEERRDITMRSMAVMLLDDVRREVHPESRHEDEPEHRLLRGSGHAGSSRRIMTRVHRLEHVDALLAAHLATTMIRPHAQRVLDEVSNGDLAGALDGGLARLEADHVSGVGIDRSSAESSMVTISLLLVYLARGR